jgi:hypothetical protein
MAVSDDTILRLLKHPAAEPLTRDILRAVGIDDWAWQKGQQHCGTIFVDQRRFELKSPFSLLRLIFHRIAHTLSRRRPSSSHQLLTLREAEVGGGAVRDILRPVPFDKEESWC